MSGVTITLHRASFVYLYHHNLEKTAHIKLALLPQQEIGKITLKNYLHRFNFIQGKEDYKHLDGEHTVFGEIINGFNVLNKIASEPLDNKN